MTPRQNLVLSTKMIVSPGVTPVEMKPALAGLGRNSSIATANCSIGLRHPAYLLLVAGKRAVI